jgi:D-tyrosyl-tRNA(Tyr) deacylase
MKAVIQRVGSASVSVAGEVCAKIDRGMLVLVAVEPGDSDTQVQKLADKLLALRMFSDDNGKMNLNVQQAGGACLLVSQFTLAANVMRGNRPGFSGAADPAQARALYEQLVTVLRDAAVVPVESGIFAADMQVSLVNDGPVTFIVEL